MSSQKTAITIPMSASQHNEVVELIDNVKEHRKKIKALLELNPDDEIYKLILASQNELISSLKPLLRDTRR